MIPATTLGISAETVDVTEVQTVLRSLGFRVPKTGRWDEVTKSIFRAAVIGLEFQTEDRDVDVTPSADRTQVEITPAVLPAMRVVSESRMVQRPESLLDLLRAARKAGTLAPQIADEIESLRERGKMNEAIADEYERWLETGEDLLRAVANIVLPIDSIMVLVEAAGFSREEVENALTALPRATGFAGLGSPLTVAIIIGVIVAAVLAIGFGGFALASGEITQIIAHQQSTFRLLALIAGELFGADAEKVSKAAKVSEPEPPPKSRTTQLLVLGGLGVAGIVGGVFLARRFGRSTRGLSGGFPDHADKARRRLKAASETTDSAHRDLERGLCSSALTKLRNAFATNAQAMSEVFWLGDTIPGEDLGKEAVNRSISIDQVWRSALRKCGK